MGFWQKELPHLNAGAERVGIAFIFVFLAACAPAPSAAPPTATTVSATSAPTQIPPTSTATIAPSPTATNVSTETPVPCDAYTAFCVEDGHFLLARPISPEYMNAVDRSYAYGSTANRTREPHHGVEFANISGTPVLAAAAGEVVFAGYDESLDYNPWSDFYGNLVVIAHDFSVRGEKIYTLYAHLSKIDVESGQKIAQGQQLGEVGWTGAAIGSHLHFEVRVGGLAYTDTRNPELWLIPLESDSGAIVTRVADRSGKLIRAPVAVQKVVGAESVYQTAATLEAYAPEKYPVGVDDEWRESYAVSDLPAGQYRLSVVTAGKVYERFVDVRPGKVTAAYFMIE